MARNRSTVAQMAELVTRDQNVPGSIPIWIKDILFLNITGNLNITRNDGYIAMIANWQIKLRRNLPNTLLQ